MVLAVGCGQMSHLVFTLFLLIPLTLNRNKYTNDFIFWPRRHLYFQITIVRPEGKLYKFEINTQTWSWELTWGKVEASVKKLSRPVVRNSWVLGSTPGQATIINLAVYSIRILVRKTVKECLISGQYWKAYRVCFHMFQILNLVKFFIVW